MRLEKILRGAAAVLAIALAFAALSLNANAQTTIHVGYFPNVTHAQALVGQQNGQFAKDLGSSAKLDWHQFNAGPAVIEALYAGAIDIAYIGPSPTISGYVKSDGAALRVIAGASSGAASLVVRNGANINKINDFHGKTIATPQLGNTQDVALREWLAGHGFKTIDKGGDVRIQPTDNPDQLTLFLKGQLDAAWAPEPWATRLVHDGGGRIFLDERDLWPNHQFVAAHVIVSTKFLQAHPDLVKKFLQAHVELTDWINANPAAAKLLINQQIQKDTGKALPSVILNEAYSRLAVTYDPIASSLYTSAQHSVDAGFLRKLPDLSHLYDLTLLNQILVEQKKKPITQ
jgi:NitT/TauT family transport system substrate-binding protein